MSNKTERERKVWWHTGHDNKLREGSVWLHFYDAVFNAEWTLGRLSLSVSLDLDPDDEQQVRGHVCVPGVGLYGGIESWKWLRPCLRALGVDRARTTGTRIYDWTFGWRCWALDDWSSTDPKWMRGFVDLRDAALGAAKYSEQTLSKREVAIPMPEGSYAATAQMKRCTWRRPRWPFPLVITRCEIDIPKGIPIPGKGENSWDCGPDATYGQSGPASSVEEGIGALVESTLRTRQKRAGTHIYTERETAKEVSA